MSKPIPSTFGVYKPGIGWTITRANIDAYQQQLAEDKRPSASPAEVVLNFATDTDRGGQEAGVVFRNSKLYKRRLARAMRIMNKPRGAKKRDSLNETYIAESIIG